MVINIHPSRINIPSGTAGKVGDRRYTPANTDQSRYTVPRRADVNYIPSMESLRTLINSAVESLRGGIYWDRGTILNLLV